MDEKVCETYVGTDDKAVALGPLRVYWLSVSGDVGENGSVYLRDGEAATDEKKWGATVYNGGHFVFDPPIRFAHGLYVDIDTAAIKLYTVGYIKEVNLPD